MAMSYQEWMDWCEKDPVAAGTCFLENFSKTRKRGKKPSQGLVDQIQGIIDDDPEYFAYGTSTQAEALQTMITNLKFASMGLRVYDPRTMR